MKRGELLKSSPMFDFDPKESFPDREVRILRLWKEEETFQASLQNREKSPLFSFYDGPPFATGLPHYGHLLAGTIKDVIPRYKTMQGFYVPRRFGWDCHGLPVENEIEKEKKLSGAAAIEAFGIGNFNEECRKIVLRYSSEWRQTVERIGRWVDFDRTFRTMDLSFMESVWWVFKQLFKKGLVYEGFKVMPFSAQLGTPLSNFEANLNYKEVDDPSATVAFRSKKWPDTFLLAWTTTPWTLPSNLALMVRRDLPYAVVRSLKAGKKYVLAEARVSAHFKEEFEVEKIVLGEELVGMTYEPLFPFFEGKEGAFRVIAEETVSMEDGTGIVHAAPAFGEVDFYACKREGIPLVCPVDANGRFTEEVPPYKGLFVKEADKEILRFLKQQGSLFSQGTIHHRYPFCWRSDTPLIYKAVSTWFIAVEKVRDELLKVNQEIRWVPEHIKEGRFGKWLENARDWAVSRNRYWGTPIPIWRNAKGELLVLGSLQELAEKTGKEPLKDLHRHFVDSLSFEWKGERYERVPEVFDCWFESGSMPYAQNHYPFENQELFNREFPADFIGEGLDQTRGWFYTLTVLSCALFQKPAFKNVIVNGIILAEDGSKMSKRLKNYPDPGVILSQYGADPLRLYLLSSPAVKGEDLRFSERGVEQGMRQVLIPFWNAFVFLGTYAKIYDWKPFSLKKVPTAPIDRWILSCLQKLIASVEEAMESYDLSRAVEPFVGYIDQLTNWYIRRSRSRFWADEDSPDRQEAFATLYTSLLELSKVAAPFVPFLSDAIYRSLRQETDASSVHLTHFPKVEERFLDKRLEREMEVAQEAVSLGHSVRKEQKIKVRQPLARAHLISADSEVLDALKAQKELIAEELNVKEIEFHAEEGAFVRWLAKPNFPILGKKVGRKMPLAQKAISGFGKKEIEQLIKEGGRVSISIEGEEVVLLPEDVQIERKVREGLAAAGQGAVTVAFDTGLTEDLLLEGLARELVNKVNTMRREQGLEVTDRIHLTIDSTPRVRKSFTLHQKYIEHEVLAIQVIFCSCPSGISVDLNGEMGLIQIQKFIK